MDSEQFIAGRKQKAVKGKNTACRLPPIADCRGNVFLAIFGAVAMIGVLGAGVMNFSQGPVQNAISLNKKNAGDVDMAMIGQLAIMAATNTANKGDCDNDSYVEPPEFREAGATPKPVGGGLIPNSVGVSKKDSWGAEYGYCVWDYGPVILNESCQGTPGTDKRLQGNDSKIYPVIAIISAGPDGIFTTTCRSFSTGATRADQNNDGDLDDAGDLALVSKVATTDDDIIVTYSYEGAMASSGGLWKLRSSDPNTAYLNKKIEAQGATIAGTGTFERIAAIGGDFVDVISGLKLADPLVTTTCNVTNSSILRRALSGFGIEICSGSSWTALGGGGGGGGGGPVAGINDLGDGVVLTDNLFGGNNVGNESLTGTGNTGFGVNNLKNLTTGINNTAFGFDAMVDLTTGLHNTAMGWRAASKLGGISTANTAFGYEALMSCTNCYRNTVIGFQSGKMMSTASDNTAAGSLSMLSSTTGSQNTVIGFEALKSASGAATNVIAGWGAGKFLTTANANVLIGSQVMGNEVTTVGTQNVGIGYNVLAYGGTTAADNVAIGFEAMTQSQGVANVAIGSSTSPRIGSYNVAIGTSTMGGTGITSSTAIGYNSMRTATGARNTGAGTTSLYSLTTGTDNTAIGYNAIYGGTDVTYNTAAGSGAAFNMGAASTGNTAAGRDAMSSAGVKTNNTAIGFEALKAGTATSNNTVMGYQSGLAITTGADNTAIGHLSLYSNTTGTQNTIIGYQAGRGVTSSDVTIIGGQSASSGFDIAAGSVYVGFNSYPSGAASALNTAIGHQAMVTSAANANNAVAGASSGRSPGAGNSALGYTTLQGVGVSSSVAIGNQALQSATGSGNVVIGSSSAVSLTTSTKLTAFGNPVAATTTPGDGNTLFGKNAGQNLTGASNTGFGVAAIRATGSKDANTAIGYYALTNLTTGSNNTAAGYYVFVDTTTGSNNTGVGRSIAAGASASSVTLIGSNPTITADLSNSTAIGYNAAITASNTVRFGDANITNISGQVAFTATSDKRVKRDIHPTDLGLDFIMKLQPVSYRLIGGNGRLDYGFIAQDIEKALEGRKTNLITRQNDKDKTYKMRGDDLLAPIVKAVQEQQQALDTLEKDLDSMR